MRPISHLVASVLHTIVIFMSKEAKICNTIFSRQKRESIKCINIFYLNVLGARRTFVPSVGCLEKRAQERVVLKALSRG